MSSTASNYDIPRLGTGLACAALALSGVATATLTIVKNSPVAYLPIFGTSLLYGIMMFASSYVEEEQHFWYWSTTAWLIILWIKW